MSFGTDRKGPESARLVVGVGASAGGLDAFRKLLRTLPDNPGMTFLLVQHLDPTHESRLVDLIESETSMDVVKADQATELEVNTVYVIRPATTLAVRDGRIELTEPAERGVRRPVDHLFHSLAREYAMRAVGIVLTGAGSDGSGGIPELKNAGGLTIAQTPESAPHSGMPRAAIQTGAIDLVLEIDEMYAALDRFAQLPLEARRGDVPAEAERGTSDEQLSEFERAVGDNFETLATILDRRADLDIRAYKPGTVARRVFRRMTLAGFETVEDYVSHLQDSPAEQQALLRDLLISVTSFFRDPAAFGELRSTVIQKLVMKAEPDDELRVWVPGCATGEEAYSIAMEFLDEIELQGRDVELHIFATDVDEEALAHARSGVFPAAVAEQMPKGRLAKHFKRRGNEGFQALPRLRETLSFAVHDLIADPPFSRMDLVSCRNVLIYLQPDAQKYVLEALHFSLGPERTLFLGASESVGPRKKLYKPISKKCRIFQKVGPSVAVRRPRPGGRRRPDFEKLANRKRREPDPVGQERKERENREVDLARRALLEAHVPPSIVVSEDGSILYLHGEVRPYLKFPEGENPALEFSSMIVPDLSTRTSAALYRCRRHDERVVVESSPDGADSPVRIIATPATDLGEKAVVLSFIELEREKAPEQEHDQKDLVAELEKELEATREDLRNTVEELETANEELRSSNEEAMSMNEELQAANEELEASSEELRSLNQELTTVNAQLREKVEQVERAHNDLNNFFASTKIATVFLNDELRIERFTPAAEELLGLHDRDTGRYIGDVSGELLQSNLIDEARGVLEELTPNTRELRTKDGRWIDRRLRPYRTENRRIEGVVVTFVDVTELQQTAEKLSVREQQSAVIARLGVQVLTATDIDVFLQQTVREVQQTLQTDYCSILALQPDGTRLVPRASIGWDEQLSADEYVDAGLDSQAGFALGAGEPVVVDDLAAEKRFSDLRLLNDHDIVSGISCVIRENDTYGVISVHTRTQREFAREDANFLQGVAGVVGSAIARYQARVRLAIDSGIAQALTKPRPLDDAFFEVMECFSSALGASVGELWWPTPDGTLGLRAISVEPPLDTERVTEEFCRATPRFEPGHGPPGRVFESAKPVWMSEFMSRDEFPRVDAAREAGLRTGIAIPIVSGGRSIGVLTMFATHRLLVDNHFMNSLIGVGRSIGEFSMRSEIEAELRQLAAVTSSSQDSILAYDMDDQVTLWLQGAERLFGYTSEEMVGSSVLRLIPDHRREEFHELKERVSRGEEIEPIETQRLHKDGSTLEVSVRCSPIRDVDGEVVGVSSTDRDISALKETQRQLETADEQKDEFLAMLGHELRNPLAAVRNAAKLLQFVPEGEVDLDKVQGVLERQTEHMSTLIDGLLDISRMARGKISLEYEVLDLRPLCKEIALSLEEEIRRCNLSFEMNLPSDPVWVYGDRVRLVQIFDNLVSNAIKYNEEGGHVELSVTVDEDDAVVRVSDDGIGIDLDLLPHIFDEFRQASQSLDRAKGGLGLGLSLVKSLVTLHDGEVTADSDGPGTGSEFEVRLPLTDKRPEPDEPAPEQKSRWRLLVIEDNADLAEGLEMALELAEHDVEVAHTGEDGLDLADEGDFDAVLCDVGLPDGMSGFDVARALRENPRTKDLTVVALSGYGRTGDRENSASAGFDAHITKPADVATIETVLEDTMTRRKS